MKKLLSILLAASLLLSFGAIGASAADEDVRGIIEQLGGVLYAEMEIPSYACAGNPDGEPLALPRSRIIGGLLSSESRNAGIHIISAVLAGFLAGNSGRNNLLHIFEAMPYYKDVVITPATDDTAAVLNDAYKRKGGGSIIDNAGGPVRALLRGVNNLYIFLIPTKGDGIYEIAATYATNTGKQMLAVSGIFMDVERGILYTRDEKGIFGLIYSLDYAQNLTFSEKNGPHRIVGFTPFFDKVSPFIGYDIDTFRIFFNVGELDYMFQVWAGNYYSRLSVGGEQALYHKPVTREIRYFGTSDIDYPMTMDLFLGDELLFSRDWTTWWLTGYQKRPFVQKEELRITGTVEIEDNELRSTFYKAFQEQTPAGCTVSMKGSTITYDWDLAKYHA